MLLILVGRSLGTSSSDVPVLIDGVRGDLTVQLLNEVRVDDDHNVFFLNLGYREAVNTYYRKHLQGGNEAVQGVRRDTIDFPFAIRKQQLIARWSHLVGAWHARNFQYLKIEWHGR